MIANTNIKLSGNNYFDKQSFSYMIENVVSSDQIGYISAISEYCERNGMEVETAAKLCTNNIKDRLKLEASDMNLLKEKLTKLPVD
jgi:DNA-directed RNA polymerase alpha subunit